MRKLNKNQYIETKSGIKIRLKLTAVPCMNLPCKIQCTDTGLCTIKNETILKAQNEGTSLSQIKIPPKVTEIPNWSLWFKSSMQLKTQYRKTYFNFAMCLYNLLIVYFILQIKDYKTTCQHTNSTKICFKI